MRLTNSRPRSRPPFKPLDVIVGAYLGGLLSLGASLAQTRETIAFDIPAQPLDQALAAFSVDSGLQIFYENSLTTGHHSTAVKGVMGPGAALRILLWGSGLSARVIAADTISVVKPRDSETITQGERLAYIPYYGFIQTSMMKALCQRTETRPGRYHIALQYWIDPIGRLTRLKLIGSSQSAMRDAAIIKAVRGIALPPPGDMPQPVTMVIEPTSVAAPNACGPNPVPGRS
jgi:hypothetical protein